MNTQQLHKAQISVLRTIRHAESVRYSDLMRPTGMESDSFKFHLRKLVKSGYITKNSEGAYYLTTSGKEFANNLDRASRTLQKQPKLSVMVIVSKTDGDGTKRYLFQKRLRNPYWNFWGLLSGPIRWGITPEEAAAHELQKQAGLTASFDVRAFYRKQDYVEPSGELLEDKQFIIVDATSVNGELSNAWSGGYNAWLTLQELADQPKSFSDTLEVLDMLPNGKHYLLKKAVYDESDY